MEPKVHPIFQSIFTEMAKHGLLPRTERDIDRELELEGVCALPDMDAPEPFPQADGERK